MRILSSLLKQIPQWDRASQIALFLALGLLVLSVGVYLSVPALSLPAGISSVGLLLAVQGVFLWGNRHLVTPYTQAQRHAINGDFAQTRDTLLAWSAELEQAGKKIPLDAQVLLANAYRSLGEVQKSLDLLEGLGRVYKDHPLVWYALGRARLASGDYRGASDALRRAIAHEAPPSASFDLLHAEYRLGNFEGVTALLATIPAFSEAYRQLFVAYLNQRFRLASPPSAELLAQGLPFWQAECERFGHTPYGRALQDDVKFLSQAHG